MKTIFWTKWTGCIVAIVVFSIGFLAYARREHEREMGKLEKKEHPHV